MYISGGDAKMMGQLFKYFMPIPPNASPVVANSVSIGIPPRILLSERKE
jgi:hypothetical protein